MSNDDSTDMVYSHDIVDHLMRTTKDVQTVALYLLEVTSCCYLDCRKEVLSLAVTADILMEDDDETV